MNKTGLWIIVGVAGGMTALGAAAAAIWNCKQMRTARAVKRTGKILYKVGSVLQNVSCVAQDD